MQFVDTSVHGSPSCLLFKSWPSQHHLNFDRTTLLGAARPSIAPLPWVLCVMCTQSYSTYALDAAFATVPLWSSACAPFRSDHWAVFFTLHMDCNFHTVLPAPSPSITERETNGADFYNKRKGCRQRPEKIIQPNAMQPDLCEVWRGRREWCFLHHCGISFPELSYNV